MPTCRLHCVLGVCLLAILAGISPAWGHPGSGIAIDAEGRVYFMDTGHGAWRVDRDGSLTSLGLPAFHFLAMDPSGQFLEEHFSQLPEDDVRVQAGHPALLLASSYPVAVGSDGAFYFPQVAGTGRVRMMRMVAGEKARPFATLPVAKEIGPDGREIEAEWVWGLAAGPDGSLYYTERSAVRRIASDGAVTLVAGNITVPDCEHPPAAEDERLGPALYGLDVADDGTVYVAASACSALLKITPDGNVSVALRGGDGWSPQGVCLVGDLVYVLEYDYIKATRREDWLPRVRKLSPDGAVTTIAEIKNRDVAEERGDSE